MFKNPLLERMMKEPLEFTHQDMQNLVATYLIAEDRYNFDEAINHARQCIKRIYDLNEQQLLKTSSANEGVMGWMNKRSAEARQKRYFDRIYNQKDDKKYVRVYVEGDSWFLFPGFVKDIIDWLEDKRKDFLIYSDAYAGDWLTNIFYEGQYVEGLSTHAPDVFLLSGGGNDLVGNNRMAVMVSKLADQKPKYSETKPLVDGDLSVEDRELIMLAQPYIAKEFYAFLLTMKLQYTILFKNLYSKGSKHEKMICVTHGYAYPYPSDAVNYSIRYPLQPVVNYMTNTGQWLFRPLMIRGILDPTLQRAIVLTFIYEFNNMLIELAHEFANVYHVDCRDIPKSKDDWYDELHLKNHAYEKIAGLYEKVIDNRATGQPNVIRYDNNLFNPKIT